MGKDQCILGWLDHCFKCWLLTNISCQSCINRIINIEILFLSCQLFKDGYAKYITVDNGILVQEKLEWVF